MTVAFEQLMREGGDRALRELSRFHMQQGEVHKALRKITTKLGELQIPYAVAGGMATFAHGHLRATVDVDILVTPDGLKAIHEALEGLGYVAPFAGSKNLRDTETGVRIEFLVSGQFPGDGKPKPVAFPNPQDKQTVIDGIKYLSLEGVIELKIASGLTGGAARLKDFADVVELIGVLNIPREFGARLNPYVQPKFYELWDGYVNSPKLDY